MHFRMPIQSLKTFRFFFKLSVDKCKLFKMHFFLFYFLVSPRIWLGLFGYSISVSHSLVVSQFYESQVYDEYVIKGNAAVLKCNIPSFVSDHVEIVEWVDSNGEHYTKDENSYGKCLCWLVWLYRYVGVNIYDFNALTFGFVSADILRFHIIFSLLLIFQNALLFGSHSHSIISHFIFLALSHSLSS